MTSLTSLFIDLCVSVIDSSICPLSKHLFQPIRRLIRWSKHYSRLGLEREEKMSIKTKTETKRTYSDVVCITCWQVWEEQK